jgi:tetratricopeptide (TPR) repeat protein
MTYFSSNLLSRFLIVSMVILLCATHSFAQLRHPPEAVDAYEQGLAELEQKNYDAAIRLFDTATSLDDTYAEAYSARGDALKALKDYSTALKSYKHGLDIDASLVSAYNGRGECYRELGQIDMAFNDFTNAIELNHGDPSVNANLGMLYVDNRDPMRGLPYLDKAIEKDDQNAKAYRSRGLAEAMMQQFDEAIVDLEKAISLDPEDSESYSTLANVHVGAEHLEQAIEAISVAIVKYQPEERTDPDVLYSGYLQRAQWQMLLSKESDVPEKKKELYEAVISDCESILKEYPDTYPQSGQALFQQGIALRMLGRFSEAIKALTDSIQVVPAGEVSAYLAEAYLKRGICWHYQGQDTLARGDFNQASSINYEDSLAYFWLGITYAQDGDFREAINQYSDAIAKNPSYTLALVNRGLAYVQLELHQKAVDNFNEAIGVEPSNPELFYKRGMTHLLLEEHQKAADSFSLSILNDAQEAKHYRGMANALRGLGKNNLALEYENKAQQVEAGSGQSN